MGVRPNKLKSLPTQQVIPKISPYPNIKNRNCFISSPPPQHSQEKQTDAIYSRTRTSLNFSVTAEKH
ncbi:hypothetical protein IMY05_010G0128200 [Salix suchowensis]|nr:hypothetical protein IMY05_010G0128200 [Salix suchowensis]